MEWGRIEWARRQFGSGHDQRTEAHLASKDLLKRGVVRGDITGCTVGGRVIRTLASSGEKKEQGLSTNGESRDEVGGLRRELWAATLAAAAGMDGPPLWEVAGRPPATLSLWDRSAGELEKFGRAVGDHCQDSQLTLAR